jgi:hypothetical protein
MSSSIAFINAAYHFWYSSGTRWVQTNAVSTNPQLVWNSNPIEGAQYRKPLIRPAPEAIPRLVPEPYSARMGRQDKSLTSKTSGDRTAIDCLLGENASVARGGVHLLMTSS